MIVFYYSIICILIHKFILIHKLSDVDKESVEDCWCITSPFLGEWGGWVFNALGSHELWSIYIIIWYRQLICQNCEVTIKEKIMKKVILTTRLWIDAKRDSLCEDTENLQRASKQHQNRCNGAMNRKLDGTESLHRLWSAETKVHKKQQKVMKMHRLAPLGERFLGPNPFLCEWTNYIPAQYLHDEEIMKRRDHAKSQTGISSLIQEPTTSHKGCKTRRNRMEHRGAELLTLCCIFKSCQNILRTFPVFVKDAFRFRKFFKAFTV